MLIHVSSEYVALKFVVSNPPNKCYEKHVLQWLSLRAPGPSHPGRKYVVRFIESFTINGPNGQHDVLVTEVVGPSLAAVQSECYDFSIGVGGAFPPLPTTRVARQLLMALDYLRTRRVIHGGESIACLPVTETETNMDNKIYMPGISQRPCQILEENLKQPL
jgi:serine/threonine protein kinase